MSRARLLALASVLVISACDGDKDDTGSIGDGGSADGGAVGDGGGSGDGGEDVKGTFSGRIVDESGSPIEGATVNMCSGTCYSKQSDANGEFLHSLSPKNYSFEVIVAGDEGENATPLAPKAIVADVDDALSGDLVVPKFQSYEDLSAATTVEVAGGLRVDADPATWEAPITDPNAEPYLAGVPMDAAESHLPFEGVTGDVVAMWYLGTFDSKADLWPFEADNTYGLAAGASVHIWAADYLDVVWADGGTATVSEDGLLITSDTGSGIPVLSTLILVAE